MKHIPTNRCLSINEKHSPVMLGIEYGRSVISKATEKDSVPLDCPQPHPDKNATHD